MVGISNTNQLLGHGLAATQREPPMIWLLLKPYVLGTAADGFGDGDTAHANGNGVGLGYYYGDGDGNGDGDGYDYGFSHRYANSYLIDRGGGGST
jgi:hypothetical protein